MGGCPVCDLQLEFGTENFYFVDDGAEFDTFCADDKKRGGE